MTLAVWCVFLMIFYPLVFTGIAKFSKEGYNNATPREFLASLDGYGKRSNFVQKNHHEIFPAFAIAVIVAHMVGAAKQGQIDFLAVAFVMFRSLYGYFYVTDSHVLRTLNWLASFICVMGLFLISIP